MQVSKTQAALLQQIHDGLSVVTGDDVHTLKWLIRLGLADGKNTTADRGPEYSWVQLTPDGKELLHSL